jgi:CubicO group peptidase (beta-lactamase class C family)
MFRRHIVFIVCLASLCFGSVTRSQSLPTDDKIYDIPRCGGDPNQKIADWGGLGLRVDAMCCVRGVPWPKATPAPSLQIAWNESGLFVSVTVHHAHPWEFDYIRHLFKGDSIEFFVSPQKGSRDRYMLLTSPGLDPRYSAPRHCFFADPSEEAEKDLSDLTFDCVRNKTADGYHMQVLLPWSNLHIQPTVGTEIALQVYVMEAEPNAIPVVAMWNPAGESFLDPRSAMRIRLAEKADAPFTACATAQDDDEHQLRIIRIVAEGSDANKRFELKTTEGGVVYGVLFARKTQSFASLSVPLGQTCQVAIDSAAVPVTLIPPEDDLVTILTGKLRCLFRACVFQGNQFPRPYVEGAPHFRIASVVYYNAAYTQVDSAASPGRYGAVIEIADAKGKTTRRYRTLFRIGDSLGPWHSDAGDLASLPDALAVDSRVVPITPLDASGNRDLSFLQRPDALANPDTAALAACLFDKPDGTNYRTVDRQWWVGLKRKLNGWDRQFPLPFVCPSPDAVAAAPTPHFDTNAAAAVKTEKVAEIDRIVQRIEHDAGEPIAICLVHKGVIFFHHAYGQIAGRPFTVDDPCDIQSATKPLGGALMMEVLDTGLIRQDESLDQILPSFKNIPVKRKMIVRDLYDHLSGLTGDWGDQIHDTDEIIAGYYPALDVGNYAYNELGFALGGKIIEAVSGEAYPLFAQSHLLIPLGMDHTRVTNGGGHNATTSLDYARFGQLLLNRGASGQMRFFSEKTFKEMLPASDGSNRRGIGLMWMNWQKYGFSTGTFGHNAGNSSVLAVDPAHDLVVVVVSGGVRKDFANLAGPLYKAIIDALNR